MEKVRPPFPNLAIFNVTAVVLAFFGYEDEARDLLWGLSPQTRKYFAGHREILSSFLISWKAEITQVIAYGNEK